MEYVPEKRRGSCACASREREKVYMFRGYPTNKSGGIGNMEKSKENHVSTFDFHSRTWAKHPFGPRSINPPVDAGACGTIIDNYFYMFGGWQSGRLINAVHRLDLDTFVWKRLEWNSTDNQPLLKNKCGIASYGKDMLCVFCGYGYPDFGASLQKGAQYAWERQVSVETWIGWTNEIHLFHIQKRIWVVPEVAGTRPKPCAAFSYHYIDRHRVLLFGGRQKPERVNEVYILDMATWHCSGALISNSPEQPWPIGRSLQTSFCLFDPLHVPVGENKVIPREFPWLPCSPPTFDHTSSTSGIAGQKVFVLWGMDNDGEPINDSWVLDINTITWTKANVPDHLPPRIWHFTQCIYTTPNQCLAMTFGGAVENLFKDPEETLKGSSETLLFKFGVSPLFDICVDSVSAYWTDLSVLQSFLPSYIFQCLLEKEKKELLIKLLTI